MFENQTSLKPPNRGGLGIGSKVGGDGEKRRKRKN
jgi:hypothetical protein